MSSAVHHLMILSTVKEGRYLQPTKGDVHNKFHEGSHEEQLVNNGGAMHRAHVLIYIEYSTNLQNN